MASKLFKKLKESLKLGANPIKYVQEGSKGEGVSASRFVKSNIQKAQKFDPGSKYLGVSGVPGVDSQKKILTQAEDVESTAQAVFYGQQAQAGVAAAKESSEQAAARQLQTDQLAARRRKRQASYGTNRVSLGLGGDTGAGTVKTLLGG